MEERWKPFPLDEAYWVSNLGNVASTKRGKWKDISKSRRGLEFWVKIAGQDFKVSELVGELFVELPFYYPIGSEPKEYIIKHLDGDRLNNISSNLQWVRKFK